MSSHTINPALTDSEIDHVVCQQEVRLDSDVIREVRIDCYRSSQYPTAAHAIAAGGYRVMVQSYGYTATFDTLVAMASLADLTEYRSAERDVRVVLHVSTSVGHREATLPECALCDAALALHGWLYRNHLTR